jgi:hypothetical protein
MTTEMSLTITEYRCKLINKILFARSEDEVKRFIRAAIRSLRMHKVNEHLIARFAEKTGQDLSAFKPFNPSDQQWANIKAAQTQFDQLKLTVFKDML